MSRKTNASAAVTIGIDPGKNTFHLIGLEARAIEFWPGLRMCRPA